MESISNHEQLKKAYLADLRWSRREAIEQHENYIHSMAVEDFDGDEARAREMAEVQKPPCAARRVIAVIRKYWLAADKLNDSLPPERRISPLTFIFDSLESEAPDLYKFLSPMPYWPMGQDETGRWV